MDFGGQNGCAIGFAPSADARRQKRTLPRRSGRPPPPPKETSQTDFSDALEDKDALFALLCHALPWGQAAAATSELLQRYGSLADIVAAPQLEIAAIPSVGMNAAALIKCIHSASIRLARFPLNKAPVLGRWQALVDYLSISLGREKTEKARVLFLNSKNTLIADEQVAEGSVNSVAIYPRLILKRALELGTTAMILVHNHPSGDPTPSREDIAMTRHLIDAARLLDVLVHDHVIVSKDQVVSMRSLGHLDL